MYQIFVGGVVVKTFLIKTVKVQNINSLKASGYQTLLLGKYVKKDQFFHGGKTSFVDFILSCTLPLR